MFHVTLNLLYRKTSLSKTGHILKPGLYFFGFWLPSKGFQIQTFQKFQTQFCIFSQKFQLLNSPINKATFKHLILKLLPRICMNIIKPNIPQHFTLSPFEYQASLSSLDWLNFDFLYAIFVQKSILAPSTAFYLWHHS